MRYPVFLVGPSPGPRVKVGLPGLAGSYLGNGTAGSSSVPGAVTLLKRLRCCPHAAKARMRWTEQVRMIKGGGGRMQALVSL